MSDKLFLNTAGMLVLESLYMHGEATDMELCRRLRHSKLGHSTICAGRRELVRKKLVMRAAKTGGLWALTTAGITQARRLFGGVCDTISRPLSGLEKIQTRMDVLDHLSAPDTLVKEFRRGRVCELIRSAIKEHGVYASGLVREFQDGTTRNNNYGAVVTSLVRAGILVPTGDYMETRDYRNRHGKTICRVYRLGDGVTLGEVV